MKILITEFMEAKSVEMLNRNFDVTVDKSLSLNHNELKKIISNFDILIVRNKTQVNKEILENASSLKFIGRLGVGLDNIDTEYCRNNNIHVQPATGMNADSVAEYVINCSLSLLKNIPLMHQETSLGNWPRTSISSRELNGKIFGLMGFGLIAKKVSTLAKIFNAHIIAYDPFIDSNIANEFNIKFSSIFKVSGESFLTLPNDFSAIVEKAIKSKTGITPELSTSGGTSDARFIKNHAPVVEVGLVGKTMHQTDEHVDLSDIEKLKSIYSSILENYFA